MATWGQSGASTQTAMASPVTTVTMGTPPPAAGAPMGRQQQGGNPYANDTMPLMSHASWSSMPGGSQVGGRLVALPSSDAHLQWNSEKFGTRRNILVWYEIAYLLAAIGVVVFSVYEITGYQRVAQWLTYTQTVWILGTYSMLVVLSLLLTMFLMRNQVSGTPETKRREQQWPPPVYQLGHVLTQTALMIAGLTLLILLNDRRDSVLPADYTRHYNAALTLYFAAATWQLYPQVAGFIAM